MIDHDSAPEGTAVRVALWRALHVLVDAPLHVFDDEIGLRLVDPENEWRQRPDMDRGWTSPYRAAIVARARFIEDLVIEQVDRGVTQYVILGAGLDTFAQRRSDIASRLHVFEVDQPGPQAWKRSRLIELGWGFPRGCNWSQSTSRRVTPGGASWLTPVLMPIGQRWLFRRASPCTSPKTPTRQRFLRWRDSRRVQRWQ